MSKGSGRRPAQVSNDQLKSNWETIFKGRILEAVQDTPMADSKASTSIEAPLLSVPSSHRADGNR